MPGGLLALLHHLHLHHPHVSPQFHRGCVQRLHIRVISYTRERKKRGEANITNPETIRTLPHKPPCLVWLLLCEATQVILKVLLQVTVHRNRTFPSIFTYLSVVYGCMGVDVMFPFQGGSPSLHRAYSMPCRRLRLHAVVNDVETH